MKRRPRPTSWLPRPSGSNVHRVSASLVHSRRAFVRLLAGSAAAVLGCPSPTGTGAGSARLSARPGTPSRSLTPGLWTLGLGTTDHDGRLQIPSSVVPGTPLPLVLALHGAGGNATESIDLLGSYAETYGFFLLAVDSYGVTWDAIGGAYGRDVSFIDLALRHAFDRCTVDPARVAVGGFSDGASYALGLGLANGDLFSRVIAFSPGFIPPSNTAPHGQPEFFVSHGLSDPVLPIDSASRVIVPALTGEGYAVTYVEFDGGHSVPAAIALQAVQWLLR